MFKKLFKDLTGNNNEANNANAANTANQAEQAEQAANTFHETEFDPETLHGTHYDVADFDAEVERRIDAELARRGETNVSKDERANWHFNIRRDLYKEWTGADSDQTIRWESANSLKHSGVATSGFLKEENTTRNPLLEPVHGISLRDYAGIAMKMAQGVSEEAIFKAMGIDNTIWDELNTVWPNRMAEDTTYSVSVLYGQYFAEGIQNPKLLALQANVSEVGAANLEKMKTDVYFYHELTGARQAAYEYGLDGAQWILENFGINLADFQSVAMQHMTERNQNWSSEDILHYNNYQQEKQAEYAAKFAAEQGGNVADDVEF